jgi:hypothetical protein
MTRSERKARYGLEDGRRAASRYRNAPHGPRAALVEPGVAARFCSMPCHSYNTLLAELAAAAHVST